MSLKEEIGGIIYDADIYKAKVTNGQLNTIVDDITKSIEKTIDEIITDCRYDTNIMGFVYRLRKSLE